MDLDELEVCVELSCLVGGGKSVPSCSCPFYFLLPILLALSVSWIFSRDLISSCFPLRRNGSKVVRRY